MGWSIGFDSRWDRDIGYGVPAFCDHPRCNATIDRGLSFVCGGEPYGGEKGCGLFFCSAHLAGGGQLCSRCRNHRPPFAAKPDHPDWMRHQLTDESWAKWRATNPAAVAKIRAALKGLPASPPEKASLENPESSQVAALLGKTVDE